MVESQKAKGKSQKPRKVIGYGLQSDHLPVTSYRFKAVQRGSTSFKVAQDHRARIMWSQVATPATTRVRRLEIWGWSACRRRGQVATLAATLATSRDRWQVTGDTTRRHGDKKTGRQRTTGKSQRTTGHERRAAKQGNDDR